MTVIKSKIKDLMRKINNKHLNELMRKLRAYLYVVFDFLGYLFFLPLILFSKKPKIFNDQIKNILLIRVDRVGDLVLSTPAIRAVRNKFPDAKIHLLVRDYTQDLVCNNPNIDKLLIYNKHPLTKNYDLSIALHPGIIPNKLTFKSGAKIRVGYSGWGGGFFLTHKKKDDRALRIRHEVESALEIVKIVGAEIEDKSLEVSLTDEGESYADKFFKNNDLEEEKVVIIHPGSRQSHIRWKKEGFAKVADRLIEEENAKIIISGSDSEEELLEEVVSLMRNQCLVVRGIKLTELVSLIKRSKVFIGNSTGPMHIACALGVPVVAIFGAITPLASYNMWGPWSKKNIIVTKNLDCPQCHPTDCESYDCMRLINEEDVMAAAKKLLKS